MAKGRFEETVAMAGIDAAVIGAFYAGVRTLHALPFFRETE